MKYANESQIEDCKSIHWSPTVMGLSTEYFLVVDDTHRQSDGQAAHANTLESISVREAAIRSLQLNTTKGITRFKTYMFRSTPSHGSGTSSPIITPAPFPVLGPAPSVFPSSAFENCRVTAAALLTPWDETQKFDRILQFAMAYLEVIGTFLEPKHSFLLMMVIFEGLFKGPDEDASKAVLMIGRLLANDKADRKLVTKRFNQGKSSYREIRNSIAHGDLSVESVAVKDSFPGLYEYVISALNQLVQSRTGVIDQSKDYYQEMGRMCKNRYDAVVGAAQ